MSNPTWEIDHPHLTFHEDMKPVIGNQTAVFSKSPEMEKQSNYLTSSDAHPDTLF